QLDCVEYTRAAFGGVGHGAKAAAPSKMGIRAAGGSSNGDWRGHNLRLGAHPDARCDRVAGAVNSRKTLSSAQNLENKRLDFFLPSRSMVLKVVYRRNIKNIGVTGFASPAPSVSW